MEDEKPKYGWYVRDLIIYFYLIGFVGLISLSFGLFFMNLLGVVLIIIGIPLILIFIWPAIGLSLMQLILLKKLNVVDTIGKSKVISEIKEPVCLDIGCGTGRAAIKIAKELKNGGHLYGIDIYEKFAISGNALHTVQNNARIEDVQDKTTFQYGSATEIPFEDNKFDIINISSVLHEIHSSEGKEKAMQEIYRVLKPGGYAYISEWNRNSFGLISTLGLLCFVFKNKNYWRNLIEKYQLEILSYENYYGFGLFIIKKK